MLFAENRGPNYAMYTIQLDSLVKLYKDLQTYSYAYVYLQERTDIFKY